ncbi:MAG: LptF/LptG family permease, partial [Melioribacteraceae bacterium]
TESKGKIYFSPDQKKLMMDLYKGEIHESDNTEKKSYRKLRFDRHKIAMPAEQFTFEQSAASGQRGDRELGASELKILADSLWKIQTKYLADYEKRIKSLLRFTASPLDNINSGEEFVYLKAQQKIRNDEASINDILIRIDFNGKDYDKYWVEIHKKYSLPFACIIFVLIGAPLGTMMRKGGFGMAAGMSLIFFLIYWAFLIGGEKLADRGLLSPLAGIWSANLLLGILGILLMIKSAREKVTINFDFFNKLLPKSWRPQEENNENS